MPDGLRPGFIGLGAMGSGMARNLASKWDKPLAVYDSDPEKRRAAQAWGAVVCGSAAEVAERSDVVLTMLPNDLAVTDVALGGSGILAGAHDSLVLADFSTIGPWTMLEVAKGLEGHCRGVLGGAATLGTLAADRGELAVFVDDHGGLLDPLRPLFSTFAREIMPTGGLASAKTMKLLNNLLVAVTVAATSETLMLGEKAGIPAEVAIPVLLKGSGSSYALKHHFAGAYLDGTLTAGRFPVSYMVKDLHICQALAERCSHTMLFGSQALAAYRGACALGLGDRYYPIVVEWMKHIAGMPTSASQSVPRVA